MTPGAEATEATERSKVGTLGPGRRTVPSLGRYGGRCTTCWTVLFWVGWARRVPAAGAAS